MAAAIAAEVRRDIRDLREHLPSERLAERRAPREWNPNHTQVVVLGMGLVSPLAIGVKPAWKKLINSDSGIKEIDPEKYPVFQTSQGVVKTHIAGIVDDFHGSREHESRREQELLLDTHIIQDVKLRNLGKAHKMELVAVHEALTGVTTGGRPAELIQLVEVVNERGATYKAWQFNPEIVDDVFRIAHLGGSGIAGAAEGIVSAQHRLDMRRLPYGKDVLVALPGRVGAVPPLTYGSRGRWRQESTECATGNAVIADAMNIIRLGRADIVVVSSVESAMDPLGIGIFEALMLALTKSHDPSQFPKSLDLLRNGFGYGEAAGTVILASEEFARRKGLDVMLKVAGSGSTGDAYHDSDPHPYGIAAARALMEALQDAGGLKRLTEQGNFYWNLHATGTPGLADIIETRTLTYVIQRYLQYLEGASSTKPSTGHGLGASAMQEFIFSAMALLTQTLPPMIKSEHLVPEARHLRIVQNEARQAKDLRWFGNGAHGFGGSNEVIIGTDRGVILDFRRKEKGFTSYRPRASAA